MLTTHDDVIKWEQFPPHWPFERGIHWWPVKSPHKGHWRCAVMFSLICAWTNGWVNNQVIVDLRRHGANYDVIVMRWQPLCAWVAVKALAIHIHHQWQRVGNAASIMTNAEVPLESFCVIISKMNTDTLQAFYHPTWHEWVAKKYNLDCLRFIVSMVFWTYFLNIFFALRN